MSEAADVLMDIHAGDKRVRILAASGGDEIVVDAIVGTIRVEEDEIADSDYLRTRKVERMDVMIRPIDGWTPQQEGKVLVGQDTAWWTIESMDGLTSAFWVLRLMRPWLKRQQRRDFER